MGYSELAARDKNVQPPLKDYLTRVNRALKRLSYLVTQITTMLEAVVSTVPAPVGDDKAPLRALIYDSYYDKYRGAIPSVRVVDGVLRKGTKITFGASESV